MANIVVVFKILFLVLIAHSFVVHASLAPQEAYTRQKEDSSHTTTRKSTSSVDDQEDSTNSATDSLCYLSNGGSSLTLAVNEATQVGSIIGTVDVNGNPASEGGDVDLFDEFERFPTPTATGGGGLSGDSLLVSAQSENSNPRRLSQRSTSSSQPSARPLGLISEPSTAASQSASFYSLLAPTSQPQSVTSASTFSTSSTQQPFVRLEPGTKNLILVRPLDKEGAEGDANPVIHIRCSPRVGSKQVDHGSSSSARKNAKDSSRIPVRILVTDANDNAPQFSQQIYVLNISETSPIGSAVVARELQATDRDSAGPHSTLHYRVLEPVDSPLQFASPLEPTLVVASQLDYETQSALTLTIQAQDQGEPEPLSGTAQIQVNIIDFDDQNPRFLDDKYTLLMDESQAGLVGQNLQLLPHNLRAEDGDRGISAQIVYSIEQQSQELSQTFPLDKADDSSTVVTTDDPSANIARYLHLSPVSGQIRLLRQWPTNWAGSPLTLVIRATQADNNDRYTLTTLTIVSKLAPGSSIHRAVSSSRANGLFSAAANQGIEFVSDRVTVRVPENTPINEKIARVRARHLPAQSGNASEPVDLVSGESANPHQAPQPRHIRNRRPVGSAAPPIVASPPNSALANESNKLRPINYQILDDQNEQFAINSNGEIVIKKSLDFEHKQQFKLRVLATYTKFSDICQVHVEVVNVNDNKPKFSQTQYSFHLTEARLTSKPGALGSVSAQDADLNDTINYAIQAGEYSNLFDINPSSGLLSLKPNIRQLNVTSCQLTVLATDSLEPGPRHTAHARVHLHIAPQLLGRALNFDSNTGNELESRVFSSRTGQSTLGGWFGQTALTPVVSSQDPAVNSQRSSLATVVASLQHMTKGSNLLDMPMSSALLLSALLAFLLCLLMIVIVSMSVHVYRRSVRVRHQRRLASSTQLRHARIAAASNLLATPTISSPSSSSGTGSDSSVTTTSANSQKSKSILTVNGSIPFVASGAKVNSAPPQTNKPTSATAKLTAKVSPAICVTNAVDPAGLHSLTSTLSSHQSKRSYKSDSSCSVMMHCGHYDISRTPADSLHQVVDKQIASRLGPRQVPLKKTAEMVSSELGQLTNAKPNVTAYRQLPLNSLVRQAKLQQNGEPDELQSKKSGSLMAMIRNPERRETLEFLASQEQQQQLEQSIASSSNIKWPQGSFPQRVKRLTWDDELSLANNDENNDDDCYVTPELRAALSCSVSPISLSVHQYPIHGIEQTSSGGNLEGGQEHHYAEQHFLFSHPNSPAQQLLQSADFNSFINKKFDSSKGVVDELASISNQNNCLDYTFVQNSSQFQPPDTNSANNSRAVFESTSTSRPAANHVTAVQIHQQPSLSAQHHLLLQQQQKADNQSNQAATAVRHAADEFGRQQPDARNQNQPDLKLMTTALL